jgi:hypothetical protein
MGHKAADYLKNYVLNAEDLTGQPLIQMFSMRHELPSEWYRFLHPAVDGASKS